MDLRCSSARLVLRLLGLPALSDAADLTARWPEGFTDPAEGPTAKPRPFIPYLRWLARTTPVVFHGSQHCGLTELSDERRSHDTRAYGDQTAVFASQDPMWALFFAVLRRDRLRSTRNGSFGAGPGVDRRRYLFSVDADGELFGPGALYVLPADDFRHEGRLGGVLDTAHRTHVGSVRPLAWFAVEPSDFPFAEKTVRHTASESLARSFWRAGWGQRYVVRRMRS